VPAAASRGSTVSAARPGPRGGPVPPHAPLQRQAAEQGDRRRGEAGRRQPEYDGIDGRRTQARDARQDKEEPLLPVETPAPLALREQPGDGEAAQLPPARLRATQEAPGEPQVIEPGQRPEHHLDVVHHEGRIAPRARRSTLARYYP